MNIFFSVTVTMLVLISCKEKPKPTDTIQRSELSKYILKNAVTIDTSDKHLFMDYTYGMNSTQYWDHTEKLLNEKKIYQNERKDYVFDLDLMGHTYKALLVGRFIPSGLTSMVVAYSTPKAIEHDSIKTESLEFLKFMYGETTLKTFNLDQDGVTGSDTMYHWFSGGRQHIIYLHSKNLRTHRITITDAYQEYLDIKPKSK